MRRAKTGTDKPGGRNRGKKAGNLLGITVRGASNEDENNVNIR